jgi:hypothetical protein
LLEELADIAVEFSHTVSFQSQAGLAFRRRLQVGEDVHAGRVEPAEERLSGLVLPVDEAHRGSQELLVHRFHALGAEWTCVLDLLLTDPSKAGVLGGIVDLGGEGLEHATRPELCEERRVLRVVHVLWFIFGVEVVEIAEELVEAVNGG